MLAFLGIASISCKLNKNISESSPIAIIYKTKGDYYNLVPITLSKDKKEIVSYPHPSDLLTEKGYCLPTKLSNDFLLDNRGINSNSVFLSITYDEYSKLKEVPSTKFLFNHIKDENPFIEIHFLDKKNNYKYIEDEINSLIKKKKY